LARETCTRSASERIDIRPSARNSSTMRRSVASSPADCLATVASLGCNEPWVLDGELAVRKVSQLTLAFDHRVCDGATASGVLRYVADCIESPITALGDL
jgi:pyruvate/2-oxoglutarate dehydrogenase complex dihydrolipoamide acyltransferase (E2) component